MGCLKGCPKGCPRGELRLTCLRRRLRFQYNYSRCAATMTRRGCLKGSWNRQHFVDFEEQFITTIESKVKLLIAFITVKKKTDFKFVK